MRSSLLWLSLVLPTLTAAWPALAHHLGEPPGFEEKLKAADHDFDRGRLAEALAGLRACAGLARRENNLHYVRFRAALALRRLGRPQEARAELFDLARAFPKHDRVPRLFYVAARIREVDQQDKAGAEKEQLAILRRFSRSDQTTRALWRVASLRAERSLDEAVDFLRETYRRHRKHPLGPRAVYLGARLFQEHDRPSDAVRLYELFLRRYPTHGLRDDVLWHGAEVHRKAGRPERAITLLRRITATRRVSWNMGSYNTIHLDKAALLVAKIQHEDLKDKAAAARTLESFIEIYQHSFLRQEARGMRVELLADLGRLSEARVALAELEKLFPQSRFTRRARTRLSNAPR